jgi:hypothetical protein
VSRHPTPLKTYSHLAGQKRVPTEYEVVTSQLLYYVKRGFELAVPVSAWYERHQRGSALTCGDWERFADPRQTTYTKYTALQSRQEAHLGGVLRSFETAEHEPALAARWADTFCAVMAPLRFAFHGFQMIAAYVGSMAPAGRIAIAALLQSADELRRVDRVAHHLGQLRKEGHADDSRQRWQHDPAWQPLRRAVERALVAYDWAEALTALNLCLKPAVEAVALAELARAGAPAAGLSARRDALVFRGGRAVAPRVEPGAVRADAGGSPANRGVIQGFVDRWYPEARQAAEGLAALLPGEGGVVVAGRDALDALELVVP